MDKEISARGRIMALATNCNIFYWHGYKLFLSDIEAINNVSTMTRCSNSSVNDDIIMMCQY